MSAMICTDREMVRLLEPLKPHKSCHSITGYRAMSGNFAWPKPAVAAFSSALSEKDMRPTTQAMDEFLA